MFDPLDESQIAPVDQSSIINHLPAPWPDPTLEEGTRQRILQAGQKIVAIDDDPTGCQTVHDVPLLLEWSVEALCEGLQDAAPALFVLSNTRAMTQAAAVQTNREIAANLRLAAASCGRPFVVISRSDSTLRGHYPAETDALADELGPYDGVIIAPCFFEGNRYTLQGIHWVRMGERWIPAAQSESARDPVFGFSHSYLPAWVEEKTQGRVRARDVLLIDIATIRQGGPAAVTQRLLRVSGGQPVVLDAVDYQDLYVFIAGLLDAEAAGKRFLYRTAASFVRARAGIQPRPLLEPRELIGNRRGLPGLVAVGSHVPRSTAQLEALLALDPSAGIELDVKKLLSEANRETIIEEASRRISEIYDAGRLPIVYTSRELVVGNGPAESLRITNLVSAALVEVVKRAVSRRNFGYVVAKGGITSHELAYYALGARRTRVLGQIMPGVPVWRLGPESACPGMTYVVFPGNVGEAGTLREVVEKLR